MNAMPATYSPDATALPPAYLPDHAAMPARAPDAAETGHTWRLRCIGWSPAKGGGALLGFAWFELPGGLRLNDARVIRLGDGALGVTFPRRAILSKETISTFRESGAVRTVIPVEFATPSDWHAFNHAAIAAIRLAYPDAWEGAQAASGLAAPIDPPIPENPSGAVLAPAIQQSE